MKVVVSPVECSVELAAGREFVGDAGVEVRHRIAAVDLQVILIVVEMIMGHPMSKKAENVINVAGFVLLICLALFAFASDIIRIILE